MGNPAGVRRDFVGLEQRRREAAELLRQGVHQAEVARRVRAHRQSVSRWAQQLEEDRKSTRLNSSHITISYAVFCLKKKKKKKNTRSKNQHRASQSLYTR